MMTTRRRLLQGASAAAVLAEFGWIRSAAAEQASSDSPALPATAADYLLDPAVRYLNHASIGTIPAVVQQAHHGYLDLCEKNPWLYLWSDPWVEPREAVRVAGARLLGCEPPEVAITHNTTEFFNTLAQGLPLGPGDEVVFSSLNHSGASVCWEHHGAARGYSVRRFDFELRNLAEIDAEEVVRRYAEAIGPATKVLVLPHIDNLVGLRHPIEQIARAARDKGVRRVLVDGAQSAGMIPLDVASLGIDAFATSGHKWIQGPKGTGLAYVGEALLGELRAMWVTWGQERWKGDARVFEDYGTRAMPAVLALGDALTFQDKIDAEARAERLAALRQYLFDQVEERNSLTWRSPRSEALGASLVAVGIRPPAYTTAERLFELRGVVVRPFELPELNALRISPNLANTEEDIDRLLGALGR